MLSCALLFTFFTVLKMGQISNRDLWFIALMLLCSLGLYTQSNVYLNKSRLDSIYKLFVDWTLVLAICVTAMFFFKVSDRFSRIVLAELYIVGFAVQMLSYLLVKCIFSLVGQSPNGVSRVVVVGETGFNSAFQTALQLRRNEHLIGYIDSNYDTLYLQKNNNQLVCFESKVLSTETLESLGIRKIYLSCTTNEFKEVVESYKKYSPFPVELDWHLRIQGEESLDHALILLKNFPFVQLSATPNEPSPMFGVFKRAFDVVVSGTIIILASPLLLIIASIIKLTSPGPIFFKQKRHGLHGQEITVFKFRSMYVHQSERLVQATKNDSRITPIGRFIRKSSIDELPQLFNVLFGTMSLVGPRPHPVQFNEYYGPSINEYMMRHRIKPGITGLAQIYGARGETETIDKMLKRIKLDLEYVNNQSMLLDLKILFLTPFALVLHTGH